MSSANVKLRISFDFDLQVPDALLGLDHEPLLKALQAALGPTVMQGMPTVSAKQLGKSDISLLHHHAHIDASKLGIKTIPRELLVSAAPHLTDSELDTLSRAMLGKTPDSDAETRRLLRRKALAMVSDMRMVDCVVSAELTSGDVVELEAALNLTNGAVIVGDKDRKQRLKPNQAALQVRAGTPEVSLPATLSGQTISGPVIGVEVSELGAHRDALIEGWQTSH